MQKLAKENANKQFGTDLAAVKDYSCLYTLKKQRIKITQLEKVRFIKVNELKLTQVELFYLFHFMCAAANASELVAMIFLFFFSFPFFFFKIK